MTELSDNAKRLARKIAGEGSITLRSGEQFVLKGPDGAYDTAALLDVASAALELAGYAPSYRVSRVSGDATNNEIVYETFDGEGDFRMIGFAIRIEMDCYACAEQGPEMAANLLHAARTAREWASESEGK